jgi:hypothetical protein
VVFWLRLDQAARGYVAYRVGQFTRTGFLNRPPTVLLNALAKVHANHYRGRSSFSTSMSAIVGRLPHFSYDNAGSDILFESTYEHPKGSTCDQCDKSRAVQRIPRESKEIVVHYWTIAMSRILVFGSMA